MKTVHALTSTVWKAVALLSFVGMTMTSAHAMTDIADVSESLQPVVAHQNTRAVLWKVERAGLQPSYVFATLHSDDPRLSELSPAVIRAFQLSDVFAMEMIPDQSALAHMSASMFINNGPNLKMLLGESYFEKTAFLMHKFGVSPDVLIRLRPWVVYTALTMPKPRDGMFLDVILYGAAVSDGKYVHGLETADEQVSSFEGIHMDDQVAILKDIIDHFRSLTAINREMARRYSQGDLDAVAALQDEYLATRDQRVLRTYKQHIIDDRNNRIVRRIVPRIEEQNAFIAIDAGLLPGAQGVLHLLEQRGYRISPVH